MLRYSLASYIGEVECRCPIKGEGTPHLHKSTSKSPNCRTKKPLCHEKKIVTMAQQSTSAPAASAPAANAPNVPMKQYICLSWENNGHVQMFRFWGYARTVNDPIMGTSRVDIELTQQAVIGVAPGAPTCRELKKIRWKRKAEDEAVREEKRQRINEVIQRTARAIVRDMRETVGQEEEEEAGGRAESSHGEAEIHGESRFLDEANEEGEDPDFL